MRSPAEDKTERTEPGECHPFRSPGEGLERSIMAEFQIREFERVEEDGRRPYYRATILHQGSRVKVDSRSGSWQTEPSNGRASEVRPEVAAKLQAKVPVAERKVRS